MPSVSKKLNFYFDLNLKATCNSDYPFIIDSIGLEKQKHCDEEAEITLSGGPVDQENRRSKSRDSHQCVAWAPTLKVLPALITGRG